MGSASGSATSLADSSHGGAAPEGLTKVVLEPNDSAYIYMEIQLYQVEKELHLVDFKCAGYERLLRVDEAVDGPAHGEVLDLRSHQGSTAALRHLDTLQQRFSSGLQGTGRQTEEKDVSSPFPFLDMASTLIITLAEAN